MIFIGRGLETHQISPLFAILSRFDRGPEGVPREGAPSRATGEPALSAPGVRAGRSVALGGC